MATYLCVKGNFKTKSYAVKSTHGQLYLKVSTGSLPLTTETSTKTGLRVKHGGNVFLIQESYTTTTSAATTYESQYQTTRESAYQTTRESGYNTTSSAAMPSYISSSETTSLYQDVFGSSEVMSESFAYALAGSFQTGKSTIGGRVYTTAKSYLTLDSKADINLSAMRTAAYRVIKASTSSVATNGLLVNLYLGNDYIKTDTSEALGAYISSTSNRSDLGSIRSRSRSSTTNGNGNDFSLTAFSVRQTVSGTAYWQPNNQWNQFDAYGYSTRTASQTDVSKTTSQYLTEEYKSYYSYSNSLSILMSSSGPFAHSVMWSNGNGLTSSTKKGGAVGGILNYTATVSSSTTAFVCLTPNTITLKKEYRMTRYSSSTLSYGTTRASNYNTTRESAYMTTREGQTTTTSQITVDG